MVKNLINVTKRINRLGMEIEACKEILQKNENELERAFELQQIIMSKLTNEKATIVKRYGDVEMYDCVLPDKLIAEFRDARKINQHAYIKLEITPDSIDYFTKLANEIKDPVLDAILEEMEQALTAK